MPSCEDQIRVNLDEIQQRIADAAGRSSRTSNDIQLVAVTKYASLEAIQALLHCQALHLGESRPQQLTERHQLFDDKICWHMIGHLQRNKVRRTLQCATYIHSIDSLRLLSVVDRIAGELQATPKLFLEVNISAEESKQGFSQEELIAAWPEVERFRHVEIQGLMAMAPYSTASEAARPHFRRLRELRDELQQQANQPQLLRELSMGMSGDFEVAIEEGATFVRIGSRLFAETD